MVRWRYVYSEGLYSQHQATVHALNWVSQLGEDKVQSLSIGMA